MVEGHAVRIAESAEQPLAAFQRAIEARLAEARRALERAAAAPPAGAAPAVPIADAVTLSPEARAAFARLLREPPDLASLARLFREALRGPVPGRSAALEALRLGLQASGVPEDDLPASPADLARLAALIRAAVPAAADDDVLAVAGAWLLAGRANAGGELPPGLLPLLAEWRERRRPPPRGRPPRRLPPER